MNNTSNLLFICSRNQWRSPTAEKIYKQRGYSARSAGTSPNANRTVTMNDIRWSDQVFVMEKKHKNRLIAQFTRLLEHKTIHILDIPDDYKFMDPELIEVLEDTIDPYL
ncbi:MAG: low molecular weight protein tyrosine phosphatase family protein [Arenicella sp.]